MSINKKIIILYGAKLDTNLKDYDEFYDDLDDHSSYETTKISYLYDQMSGEYLFVGEVLKVIDNDNYDPIEINMDGYQDSVAYEMKREISEHVENQFDIRTELSLYVIQHVY